MTTMAATESSTRSGREILHGWGRTHRAHCRVLRPSDAASLAASLAGSTGAVIARGSGCAYGDAATRREGTVVEVGGLNHLIALNADRGIAVVEAGMTLGDLLRLVTPRGWIPPVLPGTPHVSVGGAIAADIHGKNHVGVGSFGSHVLWLVLVDGEGASRTLSPVHDGDLFWATVGGMGLTGVIASAAIQLLPCGPGGCPDPQAAGGRSHRGARPARGRGRRAAQGSSAPCRRLDRRVRSARRQGTRGGPDHAGADP